MKQLSKEEVKQQHPNIYTLFYKPDFNERKPNEGLHDYLLRKKLKCFCNPCRAVDKGLDKV